MVDIVPPSPPSNNSPNSDEEEDKDKIGLYYNNYNKLFYFIVII